MSHATPSYDHMQLSWRHSQEGRIVGCFIDCQDADTGRRCIDHFISSDGIVAYRWSLHKRDVTHPFSPFLPLIHHVLKKRQIEVGAILNALDVRGQYRDIFECYFLAKPIHRRELPLPDDLLYEQNFVADLVIQIVEWLAEQVTEYLFSY